MHADYLTRACYNTALNVIEGRLRECIIADCHHQYQEVSLISCVSDVAHDMIIIIFLSGSTHTFNN